MFSTSTKPDAADVSLETLSSICRAVSIPVVAIGGIKKENLPELAGTGIAGVAVVSAIFAAPDIRKAAEELRQLSEAGCSGKGRRDRMKKGTDHCGIGFQRGRRGSGGYQNHYGPRHVCHEA